MSNINNIQELIKEFYSNDIEWKKLSEISFISNTGIDKKINKNEKEVIILNYMDVYKNKYINKSIPKMIVTASDIKIEQCNILKGDIFLTPSSETKDEIGIASVITEDIYNCAYSYHIMRIRLKRQNFVTSSFIRYFFESDLMRKKIEKKATGITRFGLTKTKFENLLIPIPPIEIQNKIVDILDNFQELTSELISELTKELLSRKEQYHYYRNKLLSFDQSETNNTHTERERERERESQIIMINKFNEKVWMKFQ